MLYVCSLEIFIYYIPANIYVSATDCLSKKKEATNVVAQYIASRYNNEEIPKKKKIKMQQKRV